MSEATEEANATDRFKGRRYKKLSDDTKTVSLRVETETYYGLEKLAYLDDRNVRDFLRVKLKAMVEEALEENKIKPGPLELA